MTVWFVVLLLERALVELALAERTDEVLRVVLAIHGRDASAGHRLATAGTQRPTVSMEVCLTVRKTVVLEEVTVAEWHTTFLQVYKRKSFKRLSLGAILHTAQHTIPQLFQSCWG